MSERRVAVVTGGGKGIGAGVGTRLAKDGFAIAILDVDQTAATQQAERLPEASSHVVDVSSYQSVTDGVADVLGRWGQVDLLVNNAGWDTVQPFLENEPALWDRLIGVNLKGCVNLTHVVLPHMVERNRGKIVNIASDAGRVGSSGEAVYSACKGGIIAFTKAIAREAARYKVAVNCVCPGPADTPLMVELRSTAVGEKIMDAVVRATPFRRYCRPEDVAAAVAFFARDEVEFVTGQVLSVSGGLTMAG